MLPARSSTAASDRGRLAVRGLRSPRVPTPSRLVRVAFGVFVFSIPFETLHIFSTSGTFSLSRLIGLLLMCIALTQSPICFARPPAALWLFAVYLSMVALMALSVPAVYQRAAASLILTYLQMLVLFWIAANLLRYPNVAKSAIGALAAAVLVVGVLSAAGLGRKTLEESGRFTMFGEDPNSLAGMLAIGILAWIGLARELKGGGRRGRLYWLVPCVVLIVAIVRTGSRGGALALLGGVLTLLLRKVRRGGRARSAAAVFLIVSSVVLGSLASARDVTRWSETIREGRLAGRESIYPVAWRMFLERPLTGWGPVQNIWELGARTRYAAREAYGKGVAGFIARDTHNGTLWVLTEVGLLGAIPFLSALWLCLRSSWRGRGGVYGLLPFALVTCVLTIDMSVSWHGRKFYWLILALAAASSRVIVAGRKERVPVATAVLHPRRISKLG